MTANRSTDTLHRCSEAEAQSLIDKLRRLDLAKESIDDLKQMLIPLFRGYVCQATVFDPGLKLFRAGKWKPKTIREANYPPANLCTKPQRANAEGRPKFYCSTHLHTLFFEVHAHVGDLITVSHWRTTAPMLANPVGYSPEVFTRLGARRDCPSYGHPAFHVDNLQRLIRTFFCEELTRNVPEGQDHLYKLSAAIAEKHLGGPIHALIYPTMAQFANADNFAIEPDFVDANIRFLYATSGRVEKEYDGKFDVSWLDYARADSSGVLHWRGKVVEWSIKKQGDILMMKEEGGCWTARDAVGNEVLPGE